jgi:hypothetical protein
MGAISEIQLGFWGQNAQLLSSALGTKRGSAKSFNIDKQNNKK